MQTSLLFEVGAGPVYYNYWFAIVPPYRVKAVIDQLKIKINNLTENAVTDGKAYLTVVHQNQVMPALMEEKIRYYQSKMKTFPVFEIRLQNFGFIRKKNVYTIFVKVQADDNWGNNLKRLRKNIDKNSIRQAFIPIAEITGKTDFQQVWPHLEHLGYDASFMAEKLTVMEKSAHKSQDQYKPKLHLLLKKCSCQAD